MVDEIGEGVGSQQGVGNDDFRGVDVGHPASYPIQVHSAVQRDVGHRGKHVASFVVET